MNCLNKNLITNFVWYFEKEKKYDIKTLSINRALYEEQIWHNHIFFEKLLEK